MITLFALFLVFSFLYFVLWLTLKIVGVAVKIAFFPIRLVFGIVFGIVAFFIVSPLAILLIVPLTFLFIGWVVRMLMPVRL